MGPTVLKMKSPILPTPMGLSLDPVRPKTCAASYDACLVCWL